MFIFTTLFIISLYFSVHYWKLSHKLRDEILKLKRNPISQIGDRWDWQYITDTSSPEKFNIDSFVISEKFYNRLGYYTYSNKFNSKRHSDIYSYLNDSNPNNIQRFSNFIFELLTSKETYDVKSVMLEFKSVAGGKNEDGILRGIVFGYVDEMMDDLHIPCHLQGVFLPLQSLEEK